MEQQRVPRHHLFRYFLRNFGIAVGLVLIWRGIWYALDAFDLYFFEGDHFTSALLGIAVGLLILYLPDGDLKELEKL